MANQNIDRGEGDNTTLRITLTTDGCANLDVATGVNLEVFSDLNRDNLIETLTGEIRGFDPAVYFPIIDAHWSGQRFFRLTIVSGSDVKPLKQMGVWTQS